MDNKRNIAIGFVVYNSEISLIHRLITCSAAGFDMYIFDNSPKNANIRDACVNLESCHYLTAGKNVGLGYSLAAITAQAYYEGYKALVFFDQDTVFDVSTLDFIEDFYKSNQSLEEHYSSIVFNSKKIDNRAQLHRFAFDDVLLTISSGSLFYLDVLNKINWHNQSYFVDCVDYEFCLNSYNHHYKVGECSVTPGFDHITEQADKEYKIFGKKRMMRKYSLSRIADTLTAYIRIIFTALFAFKLKFTAIVFRSMCIYVYFQLLVRIISLFKKKWII